MQKKTKKWPSLVPKLYKEKNQTSEAYMTEF